MIDQFNDHGMLRNLITDFPLKMNLEEYVHPMSKDKIKSTEYDLAGFIKVQHAPVMNEYSVYLRNDKTWWFMCNNKGTARIGLK